MDDSQIAAVIAVAVLAYIALVAVLTRDPRLCRSCQLPCPRRQIARHVRECPAVSTTRRES